MIKIREIFNLPSTPVDLKEDFFTLKGTWVPEISHLVPDYDAKIAEEVAKDGRMAINTVVFDNIDGERYAMLCTVHFDNKPVLIVQEAGRSGRDYFNRWVVDLPSYSEMLVYLASKMAKADEIRMVDVIDLDAEIYPELILDFYGKSYVEKFGFKADEVLQGVTFLQNRRGLLGHLSSDLCLLFMRDYSGEAPEYIRRGGYVLKKVRLVPVDEIAENNKQMHSNLDNYPDKRVYVYEEAKAMKGVYVQPV